MYLYPKTYPNVSGALKETTECKVGMWVSKTLLHLLDGSARCYHWLSKLFRFRHKNYLFKFKDFDVG